MTALLYSVLAETATIHGQDDLRQKYSKLALFWQQAWLVAGAFSLFILLIILAFSGGP